MKPISFEDIEFSPDWCAENQAHSFYYRSGVIRGVLLYSELGGVIRDEDAQDTIAAIERVYADGGFSGKSFYRIVNYRHLQNTSLKTRMAYMKAIKRLNEQYGCLPSATYICGANNRAKASLRFAQKIIRQKMVFLDTVDEALAAVNEQNLHPLNKPPIDTKVDESFTVSSRDIDELVHLAGSSLWDTTSTQEVTFSEDNPLFPLYLALEAMSQDIIENRQRLQNSKERMDLALEAANMGIWDWNPSTDTMTLDARLYAQANYRPKAFPATREELERRIHLDDLAAFRHVVSDCLTRNTSDCRCKFRFQRKTGDYFWVQLIGKIVTWNADDEPTRFIATFRDIDEQEETREHLQRNLVETERVNRLMSGRELRVVEMKQEVNTLLLELDRDTRYASVLEDRDGDK